MNNTAKIYPYIAFENTKEALAYYEEVLGAKTTVCMEVGKEKAAHFGLTEEQAKDAIMHSMFEVLGATVMGADRFGQPVSNSTISILIDLNSEDEEAMKAADTFWTNLVKSDSVKINMPFEEQFWGGKMGDFTDKFGIRWILHAQPYSKMRM